MRSELESTGEIPQLDCVLGQDGKSRRRVIRSIHVPSDQDRHEQEKIQEAVNDKVEEEKIVRQVKEDSEQETDLPRDHDEKAQEDHLETNENDVDEPNLGQATPDQHIDTLAELLSSFLKDSLPPRLALAAIQGGVDKHFLLRLHELVDDLKDAHEDLAATIRRVSGTANCKDADEGRFEEEFVMTAEQLDEGVTERNRRWAEAKRAVLDSMEDSEAEVASGVVDGTSVARERWSTWRREFEQQQRERQEEGAVYEGMIGEEAEAVNW